MSNQKSTSVSIVYQNLTYVMKLSHTERKLFVLRGNEETPWQNKTENMQDILFSIKYFIVGE